MGYSCGAVEINQFITSFSYCPITKENRKFDRY